MQINIESRRGGRRGYAMLLTLLLVGVMLLVFASMMNWVSSQAQLGQQNNQYTMSEAAAEAATEQVLATMMRDYLYQTLTNGSYYGSLQPGQTNYDGSPWPVKYVFSDITGTTGRISVLAGTPQSVLQPLGSEYANLMGYPWYWTNIATATPIGQRFNIPVTVTQVVNFSSVPVFQYAIFYNINLEIDPGATMYVNGPVWSNAGLWAGTDNLTFDSTVAAVSNAVTTANDPFADGKSDSSAPPHFILSGQPSSGNTPLTMPIAGATNANPTNVEAIVNLPPAAYAMGTSSAYTTNGLIYLANMGDLIISNSVNGTNSANPSGTNIFVFYQDPAQPTYLGTSGYLAPVPNDFYILKTPALTGLYTNWISHNLSDTNRCYTNVYYAGWTWLTNTSFWDYRESKTVQALQINVGLFNWWLTNPIVQGGVDYGGDYLNNLCMTNKGAANPIGGLWFYNNLPMSSTLLPAVRVVNGAQLHGPRGLSVVTPMPLYVLGNFNSQWNSTNVSSGTNVAYTYPGGLMGDAITILSSSWSDAYNSSTSLASRNAAAITINAGCLEGIVPSNPDVSANNGYSGGVENFLRFLETWSGITVTYNGAIVVMFPSIYATNCWQETGNYYQAPTRSWGFDYNFSTQSGLPPMTPEVKKTVRVSWSP